MILLNKFIMRQINRGSTFTYVSGQLKIFHAKPIYVMYQYEINKNCFDIYVFNNIGKIYILNKKNFRYYFQSETARIDWYASVQYRDGKLKIYASVPAHSPFIEFLYQGILIKGTEKFSKFKRKFQYAKNYIRCLSLKQSHTLYI